MYPTTSFIMLCATLLLAACSSANGPKQGDSTNKDSAMLANDQQLPLPRENLNEVAHGARPYLIDPHNRIWRFSNGVCRYLDRVSPPWRVALHDTFTMNPEESFGEGIDDLNLAFNAPNQAFGIPVPDEPFDPHTTRRKWLIDMAIIDPRLLTGRDDMMRDAIVDPQSNGKPDIYKEAYSPSFKPYRQAIGGRIVLVNHELQTAILCHGDRSSPNPLCEGVVLLSEEESATFKMSLSALPKAEDIAHSIRMLATSLRAECPKRH